METKSHSHSTAPPQHPYVSAIVQARMTSTRLPGKILMEVMGRPLLSYLIERLRLCRQVSDVVLATTTNREDGPVADLGEKEEVHVYRGDEHDVLDRYYGAAELYGAEYVMRITGDCPLLDPQICDRVIEIYFNSGCDFVHTGPSFAEGLDCEVFSKGVLETAWREAVAKPEREHVTLYFRNHPELFRIVTVENETDDGGYRITVDEKADFEVVKAIIEHLHGAAHPGFTINEIKSFLDAHPEILSLNSSIVRNEGLMKSLEES
jgi:spore coat polysaccharide biosynthesis protein SpsF